jgi:hypothetical protein
MESLENPKAEIFVGCSENFTIILPILAEYLRY